MHPLVIGALVGAGLGYLQNKDEKKNFREQQRLNAIKARFSPWTGIHPTNPQQPQGLLGAMGGGAVGGLMAGQSIAASLGQQPQMPPEAGAQAASMPGAQPMPPTRQNAALLEHGGPTVAAQQQMNGTAYNPYAYPYTQPPSPWMGMGGY